MLKARRFTTTKTKPETAQTRGFNTCYGFQHLLWSSTLVVGFNNSSVAFVMVFTFSDRRFKIVTSSREAVASRPELGSSEKRKGRSGIGPWGGSIEQIFSTEKLLIYVCLYWGFRTI